MLSSLAGHPSKWVPVMAMLAFMPSLLSGFVYDDVLLISENEYAQSLDYIGRPFTTHFWDTQRHGSVGIGLLYYRPFVTVSFLLNWLVSGGAAWPFHLVNIALHVVCVALAVRIGEGWTQNRTVAVLAALVFAVHPSRTESVIWIAGRTDILSTLFLFLAVDTTERATRSSGQRRAVFALGTVLAWGASILCKESAVLLPLLLAMGALADDPRSIQRKLTWQLTGLTAALGAAYVVFRALLLPVREGHPLEVTPMHGLSTVAYYMERVLVPWPQTFFFRPLETQGGHFTYSTPHMLLGAMLLALGIYAFARWARSSRVAPACLFSGIAFLGPLLNFTYTGIFVSTSDHFLYLPLWLIALGLAKGAEDTIARLRGLRPAKIAIVGLCLVWVGIDAVRALEMKDNETLWERELEVNPDNPFVLREVAIRRAAEGKLDEALEFNLRSLRPESTKYALLSSPGASVEVYVRALAIDAARTPDGDVLRLRAVLREMIAIAYGRVPERVRGAYRIEYQRNLRAKVVAEVVTNPFMTAKLSAEAALIASRIGRDDDARRLLSRVSDAEVRAITSPANLILAHARIGDFAGAERRLRYFAENAARWGMPVDERMLADLRGRVAQAKQREATSRTESGAERMLLRASAYADVGAYLRALRALRPTYDVVGATKLPAYIDLLLAAGLPNEAQSELGRVIGQEAARNEVERLQEKTSWGPIIRRNVPEPSPWWPPGEGEVP